MLYTKATIVGDDKNALLVCRYLIRILNKIKRFYFKPFLCEVYTLYIDNNIYYCNMLYIIL
jgi:hypothetical protein